MSTDVERRTTDLGEGIVSRPNGLEITRELSFNEWKQVGERLLATVDRALFTLGDWRLYGERYAKDYHPAIEELDARSRFIAPSLRVSRAMPLERRRDQLSFDVHEVVAGLDEEAQDRWLDDAERQGWSRQQLQFEFDKDITRTPVAAISWRGVGELRELCMRAAARPPATVTIELPGDVDPKEWVGLVLERAARAQMLTLEEAA